MNMFNFKSSNYNCRSCFELERRKLAESREGLIITLTTLRCVNHNSMSLWEAHLGVMVGGSIQLLQCDWSARCRYLKDKELEVYIYSPISRYLFTRHYTLPPQVLELTLAWSHFKVQAWTFNIYLVPITAGWPEACRMKNVPNILLMTSWGMNLRPLALWSNTLTTGPWAPTVWKADV